jgi:hypothetical protein
MVQPGSHESAITIIVISVSSPTWRVQARITPSAPDWAKIRVGYKTDNIRMDKSVARKKTAIFI